VHTSTSISFTSYPTPPLNNLMLLLVHTIFVFVFLGRISINNSLKILATWFYMNFHMAFHILVHRNWCINIGLWHSVISSGVGFYVWNSKIQEWWKIYLTSNKMSRMVNQRLNFEAIQLVLEKKQILWEYIDDLSILRMSYLCTADYNWNNHDVEI
jgi:hypothetical protein